MATNYQRKLPPMNILPMQEEKLPMFKFSKEKG